MEKKKRRNLLHIEDPKLNKAFWWVCALLVAILVVALFILALVLISCEIDEPGTDLASNASVISFLLKMFVAAIVVFTVFLAINIYVIATNMEKAEVEEKFVEAESPLLGAAKEHQEQIIDLLRSIAKPTSGKQYLNRAPTCQFLRAMTELGYLDANVTGPNLMAWVEMATKYKDKDKDSGHFFSAYNKASKEDTKVLGYMKQIEEIVGK